MGYSPIIFGELGYEVLISSEFAAHLYEALQKAGVPFGLCQAGQYAMNHCRMEKAFRHFGHDIGEEDSPYEAGLGFAVDLSKLQSFLGQEKLQKQKQLGPALPHRLVSIALRNSEIKTGPFLIHNETIWRGDHLVGHVTSGAWGYRIGKSLGIAALHHNEGVSKSWLEQGGFEVKIAGVRHGIEVQLQPFYDAAGTRMRG